MRARVHAHIDSGATRAESVRSMRTGEAASEPGARTERTRNGPPSPRAHRATAIPAAREMRWATSSVGRVAGQVHAHAHTPLHADDEHQIEDEERAELARAPKPAREPARPLEDHPREPADPAARGGSPPIATTRDGQTTLSGAVAADPRAPVIRAHEAVHRAQFDARGTRPIGTVDQLEDEARRGSHRIVAGRSFTPQFAAAEGDTLAYDHASAGDHLERFKTWLIAQGEYDVDTVDWFAEVTAMLASTRIYHTESEGMTPLEASGRFRYRLLIEVFDQELEEIDEIEVYEDSGDGLTIPTTEDLEYALFEEYLPTLAASDFAPADVERLSDAFLPHWLQQLSPVTFVPEEFDIDEFRPRDLHWDIDRERERALDEFMEDRVQHEMFTFMLDEFARSVAGPHAEVSPLPRILPGDTMRSMSPERWLATLEAYRERLREHLSEVFYRELRRDPEFQRQTLTMADEISRFFSIFMVYASAQNLDDDLHSAIAAMSTKSLGELDDFEDQIFSDPRDIYRRYGEAAIAMMDFFTNISPGGDNDQDLLTVVDRVVDAMHGPGEHEGFAGLLRLVGMLAGLKSLLERQQEVSRQRIDELVDVSYDDVAAGIQQMGQYASDYIDHTWIPKLHEVALERISASVDILRDRHENWSTYASDTAAKMGAGATLFEDFAAGLRAGTYEQIILEGHVFEANDVQRLEDTAAIMRAEHDALSNPSTSGERRDKLGEALEAVDDVKGRIERHEEDPAHYGPEVKAQARRELGLSTFAEFTTYGDVIFGRAVARDNPFLSRLVIGWEMVEVFDDALSGVVILAAVGFLTVASLLVGSLGTAAFWIMFAIDAVISIGLGIHQVSEAEALLELTRLDLDHTVTGVSEEDAEFALTMAWIGLGLSIVLTGGALALAAAVRFGARAAETVGLSLRYFRLAREQPALFNSLRAVIRDPVYLDRLLDLAGDATQLERLLHRMDRTLDVAGIERMLPIAGSAQRLNHVLDGVETTAHVEQSLVQLQRAVPNATRLHSLLDVGGNIDDLVRVVGRADEVGSIERLDRMLQLSHDPARLDALLTAGSSVDEVETLLRITSRSTEGPEDLLRMYQYAHRMGRGDFMAELATFGPQELRQASRGMQLMETGQGAPGVSLSTEGRAAMGPLQPERASQLHQILEDHPDIAPFIGQPAANGSPAGYRQPVQNPNGNWTVARTSRTSGRPELGTDSAGRIIVRWPRAPSGGAGTRLPRTNGQWSGTPGNSFWRSNHPDVNRITGNQPIEFIDGRPDFSPWSRGSIHFNPGALDGTDADFDLVYDQLMRTPGLNLGSRNQARNWLSQRGLTPHHFSDTEIQLIPSDLHGNIPHIGSASDLRNLP